MTYVARESHNNQSTSRVEQFSINHRNQLGTAFVLVDFAL